ncbi:MAG TPA: AHH domain-containing protein [Egibacteraceae bacterium]|nr:AHH domain-containing protein [Egibacteraceae bacterium]
MASKMQASPFRQMIPMILGAVLVAVLLPTPPAQAAAVDVTINTWTRDADTGFLSYTVTVAAACGSVCKVTLRAMEPGGSSAYTLQTKDVTASGGAFTVILSDANQRLRHLDRVGARVQDSIYTSSSDWVPTGDAYPPGEVTLSGLSWTRDASTGFVSYSLSVAAKALALPGRPCVGTCKVTIQAKEPSNSTAPILTTQEVADDDGAFTITLSDSQQPLRHYTQLRARISSPYTSTPYTDWIDTGDIYPPGELALSVGRWDRDPNSGLVDYSLNVTATALALYNRACISTCNITIQALEPGNSKAFTLATQSVTDDDGAFTIALADSDQPLRNYTQLRARAVNHTGYGYIYYSDWKPVTLPAEDRTTLVDAFAVPPLAGRLTINQACETLLTAPGTHLQGTSTTDQYNDCESVRLAGGGISALLQDLALRNPGLSQVLIDALIVGAVVASDLSTTTTQEGPVVIWPAGPEEEWADQWDVEFEPQPAAAGGAAMLPPTDHCLDDSAKASIIAGTPLQRHHIATRFEGQWLSAYQTALNDYGLGHLDIAKGDWNLINIPHLGPHPTGYHRWVLDNLEAAASYANNLTNELSPAAPEDVKRLLRERLFRQAWQYVRWTLANDPTIVRKDYWVC